MARKRYQKGTLVVRGKREPAWFLRYRKDQVESGPEGPQVRRVNMRVCIGSLEDYPTERLAWRSPKIRALLDEVNDPNYRASHSATFSEFAERWTEKVLSQKTPSHQSAARSQLRKHLVPAFGPLKMRELNPELVQDFVVAWSKSPKTLRNVLGLLRLIWKKARAWGVDVAAGVDDILAGVELPSRLDPEQYALTQDEMERIVGAAAGLYRTLFWILCETGMRAGEVRGLGLRHLDLDRGLIKVRQSAWRRTIKSLKTGQKGWRDCPISDALCDHLRSFLRTWRKNELGLLFATKNGTPLDYQFILTKKYHPILKQLGIPRCGLKAFRHGFATLMDVHHVPLAERGYRMGHVNSKITLDVYTHPRAHGGSDFVDDLGARIGNAFCGQLVAKKEEPLGLEKTQTPWLQ